MRTARSRLMASSTTGICMRCCSCCTCGDGAEARRGAGEGWSGEKGEVGSGEGWSGEKGEVGSGEGWNGEYVGK